MRYIYVKNAHLRAAVVGIGIIGGCLTLEVIGAGLFNADMLNFFWYCG